MSKATRLLRSEEVAWTGIERERERKAETAMEKRADPVLGGRNGRSV